MTNGVGSADRGADADAVLLGDPDTDADGDEAAVGLSLAVADAVSVELADTGDGDGVADGVGGTTYATFITSAPVTESAPAVFNCGYGPP